MIPRRLALVLGVWSVGVFLSVGVLCAAPPEEMELFAQESMETALTLRELLQRQAIERAALIKKNPRALGFLGYYYVGGLHGLARNEPVGVQLMKEAARLGDSMAKGWLAMAYWQGAFGLEEDKDEGMRLCRESAEAGCDLGIKMLRDIEAKGGGGSGSAQEDSKGELSGRAEGMFNRMRRWLGRGSNVSE